MKKRNKVFAVALISIAIFLMVFTAFGELSLDSALLQINASAQEDFGTFRAQMTLSYNITTQQVDDFSISLKMAPADIFMSFEVAAICKVPVDKVVEVYKVQKKNGWGAMAKALGIKPGSKEFKLLKDSASGFSEKLKSKKDNSGNGNPDNGNSGSGNKKGGKK